MIDKNKSKLAILFTKTAKTDRSKPFNTRRCSRVYSILSRKASEYGIDVFVANHREYKDRKLVKSWFKHKGRWKLVRNQEIDMVYSRFAASIFSENKKNKWAEKFKYKMAEDVPIINHPDIDNFCWDKSKVSEAFPRHTPRTFLINTRGGLNIVLPELRTKKIVIKPRYGTLGRDVIITDKDKLPRSIEKNTIVQEFIDTSEGIKKVTNQMHDMRLIMINGRIDHAYIRIPKKGMLTANVAKGGKKVFVSNKDVPKRAKKVAKKVDKLFRNFNPRIFSVDFLFDKRGKPYIVECNSQPMIDKYAFGKYADLTFYDRVLKTIKEKMPIKVVESY